MPSIKHNKTVHTKLAWAVVMTAALFFFYEFVQLNFFNSIDVPLMRDFNLDAVELGQLAAMYFYANALFVFPAGNLLDRYSTKKLLLFAVFICTVGTFMFGFAKTVQMASIGRFLVGIGASFCFLSCIRLASRWFPPHRMAFVTGTVVVMAMLGGLVAQTPFALLTEAAGGWRQAVIINASFGIFLLIAVIFIVRDRPPDAQEEALVDHQHLTRLGLWKCIKLAALNPQNWLGGLYTSFMNLPVFLLGALWGMHYLQTVHHTSLVEASYATTMFFVGVIIGSPVFGFISDWLERRVLPMIVGAILSIIIVSVLMVAPNLLLTHLIILFFLIGLTTSSQVLTYPTVAELNPIYLTSTAVAIESVCIMVSGFVFQPFFGWVMEHSGEQKMANGVPIYTAENFNHAMLIIPIAFLIALVIAFFIRETNCKAQVTSEL